jgi:sugar lactone lactonase YvrE
VQVAYPAPGATSSRGDASWGDPECPGPPGAAISPHGIDVAKRPDGRTSLLAVNHGGRESVELFEVLWSGAEARLEWRGCALAPEGALFNDAVHLPGSGFLVTRMLDRDDEMWGMLRASLGRATGRVYEWQPRAGFRPVPGSAGPMPNGIEVSSDGAELYLNLYSAGEVRRVARDSGRVLAAGRVRQPDNSSWAADGRLLVASHKGGVAENMACMRLREGACGMAFEILALDPQTLDGEVIFANAGPPMGGATVAIEVNGDLLMGSFAGDRLIRARPGGL